MKTQTPIAIAIEKLKESAEFINADDSREDRYYQSGLKEAIEVLTELLPQEKEMVEKAESDGFTDAWELTVKGGKNKYKNAQQYFEENYTQQ